ncbi:MAG: 4-phosphopantetheinyl transferase superfamily protein [Proteobacteria bacterium]|nr:4-phosphopantetheinyl transferase superfamily protein [Pseudomonadota bacterium]
MEAAVTIWHIPLSGPATLDDLALLDSVERRRAERFLRDEDRWRYVQAHAAIRRILAAEIGRQPDNLHLVAGEHGKPALAGRDIHFNLSHSGDHAVLATSFVAEVGIDIETSATEVGRIAHLVLTEREMAAFSVLLPNEQEWAFLRIWTRKEALLKAVGCGLGRDPRSVEVGLGHAPMLELDGQRWRLRDFSLAPGVAGCLAADKEIAPVDIRPGAI